MSDNNEQQQRQQQEESRKKKKKSRGNRKLQRFRAKLKKQGLNAEAITMMINTYNDRSNQHDTENVEDPANQDINVQDLVQLDQQEVQDVLEDIVTRITTKRKREVRPTGVTTSISQISMVQPLEKRRRSATTTTTAATTIDNVVQPKNQTKKSTSAMKPNYLNKSDHVFKKMLSTTLEGAENVFQLVDTPEKLQYARVYAQLANDLFYLRLKQDFWEDYYKILVTTRIWPMKISKQFIKENKLDQVQFITQKNVEKYRQTTMEQLKQAEIKLNQHKQTEFGQSIDLERLSTIILAFVRKGQQKLSVDFQYKKSLLQFDINDYNFIQAFYDLKPSNDQIISAKVIWQATTNKQQAEQNIAILKKRLYIKRLPASYNILDHSMDNIEKMTKNLALNQDESATILSRRQKMIGQFKYDMILFEISTSEQIARNHTNIIASEKKKIIISAGEQFPLPKSLVCVLNAISTRVFFRRSSDGYGRKPNGWNNHRSNKLKKFNHIRLSSPIIEVAPYPSLNYIEYLANGPPFIPVCQSHFSNLSIDARITKQYDAFVNCFKNSFHDNCISGSDQRAKDFFASIKNLLLISHTTPLSPKLLVRARYEQQMIKTINWIRNKHDIIIQRSDKSKVFHLASANSYHEKSLAYMEKTQAYQEIQSGINPIKDHYDHILTILKPLLNKKVINLNIWKQYMYPNIQTIELPHLYFIPKPHKIGTPLRPIISMIRSPAIGVSHFLDQCLRPVFDQATRQTTFINDIHFVRRLEFYCSIGLLTPTTNFITFDVTDLYTMIPRNGALIALEQFLNERATNGRINGMTINILMKLVEAVLDTNSFVYEGKYYKQIRGGAMGSPFTMTLANIYMLKWEQSLIEHQTAHNELYGRYIDDVFMTTNLPLDQINILLDQANNEDDNINITLSTGLTAQFLDVSVCNNQGQLKTTVFHKPAAAPYILPFQSDHPRHVHRNIIKGALYRAVRLCSHVKDFDEERLHIEVTLLLNGYPPKFISYHFKQFFKQNNAMSLMVELNDDTYRQLHHTLLHLPTRRERKQEQEQQRRQQQQQQNNSDGNELEIRNWNKSEIRVHFNYSSGPMSDFSQKLRQLWKKYYVYPGSLMNNVTLKIGPRTNKSLQHLLVKKKPPKSMLINVNSTKI
ncbi:unnamed protein product [Adineta steineri]|uniref:Reverse transcriptase domain-containing protein n=1 Tax=Adineta steineri TaxID=433720 RepID=A0A819SFF6_9BILA|nr:unnamed protein product [Adineta steineri]